MRIIRKKSIAYIVALSRDETERLHGELNKIFRTGKVSNTEEAGMLYSFKNKLYGALTEEDEGENI